MSGLASVKVVLLCRDNRTHVLGSVGRQVVAVPGSPAGTVSVNDIGGLTRVVSPGGSESLEGRCRMCSEGGRRRVQTPRIGWHRLGLLLDHAQRTQNGQFVCQIPD